MVQSKDIYESCDLYVTSLAPWNTRKTRRTNPKFQTPVLQECKINPVVRSAWRLHSQYAITVGAGNQTTIKVYTTAGETETVYHYKTVTWCKRNRLIAFY